MSVLVQCDGVVCVSGSSAVFSVVVHLKLNKTYLLLQPFLMSVSNTLSKAALR